METSQNNVEKDKIPRGAVNTQQLDDDTTELTLHIQHYFLICPIRSQVTAILCVENNLKSTYSIGRCHAAFTFLRSAIWQHRLNNNVRKNGSDVTTTWPPFSKNSMTSPINKRACDRSSFVYIRPGQLHRWRPLPLEDAVHEHAVLPVARHVEVGVVEEDLQVPARYEARVAHVDVDVAPRAVPSYGDPLLSHQVLELAALEAGDRVRTAVPRGTPLGALRGARRGRLEGQEGPRVALGRPRVGRGHGTHNERPSVVRLHVRPATHCAHAKYQQQRRRRLRPDISVCVVLVDFITQRRGRYWGSR